MESGAPGPGCPWVRREPRRRFQRLFGRQKVGEVECEQVAEHIQSYLDGYLDAELAELLASHLDVCRDCGVDADAYLRIKAALAARGDDIDPDVVKRLLAFGESLGYPNEATAD
jgi:hypothetical protein